MRKEVETDFWVGKMLENYGINFVPQGSTVHEIQEALKKSSKKGTNHVGFPEFVALVKDFVIVIEDKAKLDRHIRFDTNGEVDLSTKAVNSYAVNGALFYALNIAKRSGFNKIFAIGISGDFAHRKITPVWVDGINGCKVLPEIADLSVFRETTIEEFFRRSALGEQISTQDFKKSIHEEVEYFFKLLSRHSGLKSIDKVLCTAGILLALKEITFHSFNIKDLSCDTIIGFSDGDKIFNAVRATLIRSNIGSESIREKVLGQFSLFKTNPQLSIFNRALGKSIIKYLTEFLYEKIYSRPDPKNSQNNCSGIFFSEFLSSIRIERNLLSSLILPDRIVRLMCELVDLKPEDKVVVPGCGAGELLVAFLQSTLSSESVDLREGIDVEGRLIGIDNDAAAFTIGLANLIFHGCNPRHLQMGDFLARNSSDLQLMGGTVGLMNPPFHKGNRKRPNQYELVYIEHLLSSLTIGSRAAVIVPQLVMMGKSKDERVLKESILKHHTLEGVITFSQKTLSPAFTWSPIVIAIFKAGIRHPSGHLSRFINFKDDGYEAEPQMGLRKLPEADRLEKKLLDVWFGRSKSSNDFCIETPVTAGDEWLYSYYAEHEVIPTDNDFDTVLDEYLTFEFAQIIQGRL